MKNTSRKKNTYFLLNIYQDESEYPALATKDTWADSRDNLHDQQTPIRISQNLVADNEVITKPRHGG